METMENEVVRQLAPEKNTETEKKTKKIKWWPKWLRNRKVLNALAVIILVGWGLSLQLYLGHADLKEEGWNYTLIVDPQPNLSYWYHYTSIDYDYKSEAGLKAFITAMSFENEQVFVRGTNVANAVTLDFKAPLTIDQADAFVKKYRLLANLYNFRFANSKQPASWTTFAAGVYRNGATGQGFGSSERQRLENWLSDLYKKSGGPYSSGSNKGIVQIQVSLNYQQYREVVGDPNVYFVEMLNQVVKTRLKTAPLLDQVSVWLSHVYLDDPNLHDLNFYLTSGPLYQKLEDFHLVQS